MHVTPADRDTVAAARHVVVDGGFHVEALAQLIEVGDLQLGAFDALAFAGFQLTEQNVQQRGLARSVAPQQANLVAALDLDAQVTDDPLLLRLVVAIADVLQLHDPLAAALGGVDGDTRTALHFTPLATLGTHLLQRTHTAFIAGTTRLDPLADPGLFLGQFLVELGVLLGLDIHLVLLLGLVGRVIARITPETTTVQLQNLGREALQEGPVVGDEQHGAGEGRDLLFQPGDGIEIQMVGRLIEQQQVRVRHQRTRQCDTTAPAAGQVFHHGVFRQAQAGQHGIDTLLELPAIDAFQRDLHMLETLEVRLGVADQVMIFRQQRARLRQAFSDDIEDGTSFGGRQVLREHADLEARRLPQLTGIGLEFAGDQLEQGRLAGAVAADERQTLAALDDKVRPVEQDVMAIGQLKIFQS